MSRIALLCMVGLIIVLRDRGYILRPAPVAVEASPAAAPAPSNTREQFALDLLRALGNAQPTPATVGMIVEWTIAEDDSDGAQRRNNPTNTTMCGHHQTGAINGDGACGVAGYASYQDGVDATVDTLAGAAYVGIVAALRANDPEGARQALWASPWAESHYGWGASWPKGER